MKNIIFISLVVLAACSKQSETEVIEKKMAQIAAPSAVPFEPSALIKIEQLDKNMVIVSSPNSRPDYPASNALDGNESTFLTTNTLAIGDDYSLVYKFQNAITLSRIDLIDNYTDAYNLGDLEVQVSQNSTNGIDGTWETITTMNENSTNFIDGDGSIDINRANTKWLRLKMTYTGTGAFGSTPAFYLSEINFYHEITL